ncbi:MAG: RNB domain-containing ribonuclease [Desulfobulbaceae bacterium]|uniref:RNB domain-containing ribonuclease n=1 Tax=Candidatus Desulfatifera sulfidica TaxID=2841691 RepID=A0A8J6T9D3_9BACT|nr:RNB domain-containing ribonuclease [Candidatus Desulfatifera sulfidica]
MAGAGKIIEYLDGGKFICGLVSDAQPKRARLINQNGREVNLPMSRVVHCSDASHPLTSREEQLRLLQETAENRSKMTDEVNLEDIWELIADEGSGSFTPRFLAELQFGDTVSDDNVSALIRAVFNDRVHFRYRNGVIEAHTAEQVDQIQIQQEKEAQKLVLISRGAQLLQEIDQGKRLREDMDESDLHCLEVIRDFYLFSGDAKEADTARQILKNGNFNRPHDPFHLLVKAGVWDKNENIPLLRQELPVDFSLAAIQQAEGILQRGTAELFNDSARRDLTHLAPITIDGPTTLDHDDAISLEEEDGNFLVGIHISDVSHYVRPGDPLFQEALQRGTSIYFPERQVPMLPRHLSQGICSLVQDEARATMSFMILLSPEAEVLRVRIMPSIIKVAKRLTYDEVDLMIENDRQLGILNELRIKLRDRRLAEGALLLPFPDVNIHVNSSGKPHVQLGASDTPARTLVSELMILTNTESARYLADRMIPGLFRAQGPPRKRLVQGTDNDLYLNFRQRKMLSRGELLVSAKHHSGLGVSQYTTVTSPIRRLLDLAMQHQLHSAVRREELRFNTEMCKDFTAVITRTLAQANNVRQQRHRYWLLKYLETRIGQNLEALVLESGPKRVKLILTDILMDFDLPTPGGTRPEPGNTTHVQVVRADALDNTIRFEW